jgi:hypothetical protein
MVTYKWPHWLRAQKEKQREIWGYKMLFLDVLLFDEPKFDGVFGVSHHRDHHYVQHALVEVSACY